MHGSRLNKKISPNNHTSIVRNCNPSSDVNGATCFTTLNFEYYTKQTDEKNHQRYYKNNSLFHAQPEYACMLNYTYTNSSGTWTIVVNMTNLEGNVWNATIPAFPYGTNVTYGIIAEDNMNNTITTEDLGYEYQYTVIPEFPSLLVLPLFMIATLAAAIAHRRKHSM